MDRDSKLIFEHYKQIIDEAKLPQKRELRLPFSGSVPKHGAGAEEAHGLRSRMTTDVRPETFQAMRDKHYDDIISKQERFNALEGPLTSLNENEINAIKKSQDDKFLENAFNPIGEIGQIPLFKSVNALNALLRNFDDIMKSDSVDFRVGSIKYLKNLAKYIEEKYDEIFLLNITDDKNNFKHIPRTKIAREYKEENIKALKLIQLGMRRVKFHGAKENGWLDEFSPTPGAIGPHGHHVEMSTGLNPKSQKGKEGKKGKEGSDYKPNEPGIYNPLNVGTKEGEENLPSSPDPFDNGKKSSISPTPLTTPTRREKRKEQETKEIERMRRKPPILYPVNQPTSKPSKKK